MMFYYIILDSFFFIPALRPRTEGSIMNGSVKSMTQDNFAAGKIEDGCKGEKMGPQDIH